MAKNTKSIFADNDIRQIPVKTTPTAETVCAFITEPSTEYDDDGQYFLRIKLKTDSKECKRLIKEIETASDTAFEDAKDKLTTPKEKNSLKKADPSYKEELNDDGEETGYTTFNFKRKAYRNNKNGEKIPFTLPLFYSIGKPLSPEGLDIWSGSLVSVAYRLVPFYTAQLGVGVSHRIEAVQIIKAVSGGAKTASEYGFAVAESAEDEDEPVSAMPDEAVDSDGDY